MTKRLLGIQDIEASSTSTWPVTISEVENDAPPEVPLLVLATIGAPAGDSEIAISINGKVIEGNTRTLRENQAGGLVMEWSIPALSDFWPYRPAENITKIAIVGRVLNPIHSLFVRDLAVYEVE